MVTDAMVEAGCKAHFVWYDGDATSLRQKELAQKQVRNILEAALSTDALPVAWVSSRGNMNNLVSHKRNATFNIPLYADPPAPSVAEEISDAVLSWMVKYDLLDAGNEYRAADVLAVLDDFKPSYQPAPAVAVKALEWAYTERTVGTYIARDERGDMYWINQSFGSYSYYFTTIRRVDGKTLYDADDLGAAKAAAQADYESRIRSALSAQVHDAAECERREQVCKETALSQWERSLRRHDLTEKDRVIGAIEAYKRQAFAFTMVDTAKKREAE